MTDNSAYIIKVKLYDLGIEQKRTNETKDKFRTRFKQMITSVLRQHDPNLYVQEVALNSPNIVETHVFYQSGNEEFVRSIFTNQISKGSLGRFLFDKSYLELTTESGKHYKIVLISFLLKLTS